MKTLAGHIEATPGVAGGKPRIAGTRITVGQVAFWHERKGMTADEIAAEYDLSLADVHAALAYYFDHRSGIDRDLRSDSEFVAALRKRTPDKVKAKLQASPHPRLRR